MRLHCDECGKPVSSEMSEEIIVRAWLECPECIKELMCDKEEALKLVDEHEEKRYEAYKDISCGLAIVDFVKWLYEEKYSIIVKMHDKEADKK